MTMTQVGFQLTIFEKDAEPKIVSSNPTQDIFIHAIIFIHSIFGDQNLTDSYSF